MHFVLEGLAERLSMAYGVRTRGDLSGKAEGICYVKPKTPMSDPETLYLTTQNMLLQFDGPAAAGPLLCICHTDWMPDAAAFPVCIAVRSTDVGAVYASIAEILYDEGCRGSGLSEVAATFLRCKSMEELVSAGYSFLLNPFAVFDGEGNFLAYSRQAGFRDANWRDTDFLQAVASGDACSLRAAAMFERSREHAAAVEEAASPGGVPMLRMTLASRGQTLGYLTVTALFHAFTPADREVTELLGSFLTLDLLRQQSITVAGISDAGCLKRFLEAGGGGDFPDVAEWLERQDRVQTPRRLLLLNSAATKTGMVLEVEKILSLLPSLLPDAVCTRIEPGIVALLPDDGNPARLDALLRERRLILGVSGRFQSLAAEGRDALRQAKSALELGKLLSPGESRYEFETYAVYEGLRRLRETMELDELMHPVIRSMRESDGGLELLHTLEAYLQAGCNKTRAAKDLFIHLNTLKYRLNLISERLDTNLDDPDTLFRLELSLRILHFERIAERL